MDLDVAINRLRADQSTEERKLLLATAEVVRDARDRLDALEQQSGGKRSRAKSSDQAGSKDQA